jgi:hypothetical protein
MKKQKARKLRLSRETLLSLEKDSLRNAAGAAVAKPVPVSFIGPCTNVISDCYACTGELDTCPSARNCPSAPPQCSIA